MSSCGITRQFPESKVLVVHLKRFEFDTATSGADRLSLTLRKATAVRASSEVSLQKDQCQAEVKHPRLAISMFQFVARS